MICPEGAQLQNENMIDKEDDDVCDTNKKLPSEGPGSVERNSFKNPKTWKKSITNFFRNQLRSTRSNDGDRPSGSKHQFEDKELTPEQKWQSLGKIFRRQSFAEPWNKSPNNNQQGENSSQNKRLAVRKVLSSYFGRNDKTSSAIGK